MYTYHFPERPFLNCSLSRKFDPLFFSFYFNFFFFTFLINRKTVAYTLIFVKNLFSHGFPVHSQRTSARQSNEISWKRWEYYVPSFASFARFRSPLAFELECRKNSTPSLGPAFNYGIAENYWLYSKGRYVPSNFGTHILPSFHNTKYKETDEKARKLCVYIGLISMEILRKKEHTRIQLTRIYNTWPIERGRRSGEEKRILKYLRHVLAIFFYAFLTRLISFSSLF